MLRGERKLVHKQAFFSLSLSFLCSRYLQQQGHHNNNNSNFLFRCYTLYIWAGVCVLCIGITIFCMQEVSVWMWCCYCCWCGCIASTVTSQFKEPISLRRDSVLKLVIISMNIQKWEYKIFKMSEQMSGIIRNNWKSHGRKEVRKSELGVCLCLNASCSHIIDRTWYMLSNSSKTIKSQHFIIYLSMDLARLDFCICIRVARVYMIRVPRKL